MAAPRWDRRADNTMKLMDGSTIRLSITNTGVMTANEKITYSDEIVHTSQATQTKSATYTMDLDDSGHLTYIDTDAFVITLPSTVVGLTYTFVNAGADGAVLITINPATADYIAGANLTKVNNKDLLNTKATAKTGDRVTLFGDGVNGWYITEMVGTWAKEA